MPVTLQENEQYRAFVSAKAQELGCFDFKPDDIVWHYTNGEGFLGILQSSTIYATQVASLNDKNETKYATDLFKTSLGKLIEQNKDNATNCSANTSPTLKPSERIDVDHAPFRMAHRR